MAAARHQRRLAWGVVRGLEGSTKAVNLGAKRGFSRGANCYIMSMVVSSMILQYNFSPFVGFCLSIIIASNIIYAEIKFLHAGLLTGYIWHGKAGRHGPSTGDNGQYNIRQF